MLEKIKKDVCNYYYMIIIVIAYLLIMQLVFKQVCPVKILFNINCPGCGVTHATYYIFTGNFVEAIRINWSAFFWIAFFVIFFIDRYIHKFKIKVMPNMLILVCIVTFVRYIFEIIM